MTDLAIHEAAARALYDALFLKLGLAPGAIAPDADYYDNEARAVLTAVTPLIEAKVLEEASEALMDQWLSNHAEHCGVRGPPWPHAGMCHWPMPEILTRLRARKEQP
jgi:hypothetical protein